MINNFDDEIINEPLEQEVEDTPLDEIETPEEEVDIPAEKATKKKEKKKRNKLWFFKFYKHQPDNDIRYQGKLSFVHLRIIGWFFFAGAALSIAFKVGRALYPETIGKQYETIDLIMSSIATLPVSLFLVANFAVILQSKENYKFGFTLYGSLTMLIYAGVMFIILRYGAVAISRIAGVPYYDAASSVSNLFSMSAVPLYKINIFVDLFLLILSLFFADYKPKKYFQGKKLYLFRALILIPIAYEVTFIFLKYFALKDLVTIPFYIMPIMPTKPVFVFFAFLLVIAIKKIREKRWFKHGRTQEEYNDFLYSNRNQLHFSLWIMVVLIIAIILDTLVLFVYAAIRFKNSYFEYEEGIYYAIAEASELGFGDTFPLLFIIPILPFFSYQKRPKKPIVNILVPVGGILFTVIVLIEGVFNMFIHYFK